MVRRISITGPECSGKTSLAKELAEHYQTLYVPEYSVTYLNQLDRKYTLEDIETIAKKQLERENELASSARSLLFCDTDLMVNKVWSEVVFMKTTVWLEQALRTHHYNLSLLCYPNLDWEPGPFRENPEDRLVLFEQYRSLMDTLGYNFQIIRGKGEVRVQQAIKFVDAML